jgi:hypothetical protein
VGSTFKVLIRDSDSVESSKPAIAQEYILFTNAVRTCGRFKVAGIYQDLEACPWLFRLLQASEGRGL